MHPKVRLLGLALLSCVFMVQSKRWSQKLDLNPGFNTTSCMTLSKLLNNECQDHLSNEDGDVYLIRLW